MEKDHFVPAKRSIVLALAAILAVLVLGFAMVLRYTMRSATNLDPSGYTVTVPEGFRYSCEFTSGGGAVNARGWAAVQGEGQRAINCRVVLYHAASGSYLALPTTMEINEDATNAMADGREYGRAGFVALVPAKQLAAPLGEYELCFAYRTNGHNELVHTGQMAAEGAA